VVTEVDVEAVAELLQTLAESTYIPVSQDASERLGLLHKVHVVVRSVLQPRKDEMQTRSEPSTSLHFVRGGKVILVTKNLFLRGQPDMKLRGG
jgi:hypothetical protein